MLECSINAIDFNMCTVLITRVIEVIGIVNLEKKRAKMLYYMCL